MNLFVLLNHELTPEQRFSAEDLLKVSKIISLPTLLKERWANIPAHADAIRPFLIPILKWLDSEASLGSYVLVQGDPGACHLIVNYCRESGLVPIYATTEREILEERIEDSEVTAIRRFKHCLFRRYGE